ncbi:sigma-70 family RNA polymerase sigma factor [Enterococcus sp. AZ196]|uniref:sigma-70 family RNA polymerase sigma factor n=1 Tax=Enterococcus sp. AZ196 TaxID=2774659 RepID=UPI003D26B71C
MKQHPNHSIREAQLVSYITRIIRNAATNYYIKENRRLLREYVAEPEKMRTILNNERLYRQENQLSLLGGDLLEKRLATLTEKDWELLRLKYELQMTDKEIAKHFHLSTQAINRRKNLILIKLREVE